MGRTSLLLLLYPLMLLTGWLRLWVRERGRAGLAALWQTHGPRELYRYGWQEAMLDVYCLAAALLLLLAGGGICLVLYFIVQRARL